MLRWRSECKEFRYGILFTPLQKFLLAGGYDAGVTKQRASMVTLETIWRIAELNDG